MSLGKRAIIAIDIDDVVADTISAIAKSISDKSGLAVGEEHFKHPGDYWGYYEELMERLGLPSDEYSYEKIIAPLERESFELFPIIGAKEAVGEISKFMDVVFITARSVDREEATKKWVEEHFQIPDKFVHVIGNRRGGSVLTKGEICIKIGASWLVDDNPEHCLSAIEHGVEAILFGEYGWHHNAPEHLHRCKSWQEIEDLLVERHGQR